MAEQRITGISCMLRDFYIIDEGTLGRSRSQAPGPLLLNEEYESYSYSISGNPGVLGSMLFTEVSQRLSGTLYDHTVSTTQLRKKEVTLGASQFANQAFRQSALKTLNNLNNPNGVDVEIHIETSGAIETVCVRGHKGVRLFTFDINEAKKRADKLPDDAGPVQVFNVIFNDIIDEILRAVIQLR